MEIHAQNKRSWDKHISKTAKCRWKQSGTWQYHWVEIDLLLESVITSAGIDLDVGIRESSDSRHCAEVLDKSQIKISRVLNQRNARSHTWSKDLFSNMIIITCLTSAKEPPVTAAAKASAKKAARREAMLTAEEKKLLEAFSCLPQLWV